MRWWRWWLSETPKRLQRGEGWFFQLRRWLFTSFLFLRKNTQWTLPVMQNIRFDLLAGIGWPWSESHIDGPDRRIGNINQFGFKCFLRRSCPLINTCCPIAALAVNWNGWGGRSNCYRPNNRPLESIIASITPPTPIIDHCFLKTH